ncbi:MAG: hypothetical protein ACK5GV_08830 [Bacteroidota bacterium]|jgi:hypothetical protein
MFKKKAAKKYTCTECDSIIEIKILSNESEEHNKIQFCPFCGDYLDDESEPRKHEDRPLLKDFDDYDEFDDEKYYDDYEEDLDDEGEE